MLSPRHLCLRLSAADISYGANRYLFSTARTKGLFHYFYQHWFSTLTGDFVTWFEVKHAKRLTDCVREDDTVARLGGDEFTVILTSARQRQDVELVAQTIIDALAVPFHIEQSSVKISVSIGIACYPQDATSPVALLEAADQAMYRAKKSVSNRMYLYDTSDRPDR